MIHETIAKKFQQLKMNFKVLLFFLLVCISECISFEYYEDYDSFASTQVSSTTTTFTTTSTTTPTITTTHISTTSFGTPASEFGIVPRVDAKRNASKTRASFGLNTTIEAGRARTEEVREHSSNVDHKNDYQQNRRRQEKCASDSEKELLKKIYDILRVPSPLDELTPPTTTQQPLFSMDDLEEATTTTRVERDHPNPYGPVRNFKKCF